MNTELIERIMLLVEDERMDGEADGYHRSVCREEIRTLLHQLATARQPADANPIAVILDRHDDATREANVRTFGEAYGAPAAVDDADVIRDAIRYIRDQYPIDLFPDNHHPGARMARLTCDNIEREFKKRMQAALGTANGAKP